MFGIANVFRLTLLVLLLATFIALAAQTPQRQWARSVYTNDYEHVNDLAADRATNNVYIVGNGVIVVSSRYYKTENA